MIPLERDIEEIHHPCGDIVVVGYLTKDMDIPSTGGPAVDYQLSGVRFDRCFTGAVAVDVCVDPLGKGDWVSPHFLGQDVEMLGSDPGQGLLGGYLVFFPLRFMMDAHDEEDGYEGNRWGEMPEDGGW
jgi:hypothetical protein